MGLWPGWGLRGGDEREPTDSETVKKTGVHLSEWNSSRALNDDMCFLLEWGKDGAGRILVSLKSRSQNNNLNANKLSERRALEAPEGKWKSEQGGQKQYMVQDAVSI